MTSRRGELTRTQTIQACLNALMPLGSVFSMSSDNLDWRGQAGIFLEDTTTIHRDEYWVENGRRVLRRIAIHFVVEETDLGPRD